MSFQVTLLGTGSPRPSPTRSQPANLVEIDGHAVLVDAGDGTIRRLMEARVPPDSIHDLLITHLHKDHMLGYPGLVWAGWTLGRRQLHVRGPEGTRRMHELLFGELFADDMRYSEGIGFEPQALAGVTVEEIEAQQVFHIEDIEVRTARTIHSFHNLAYRLMYADRSVVFTGDTTYCDSVVELARGADVFVCEVTLAPSPDYENERGRRILSKLEKDHCTPEQAAAMAREADVGRMIVNHLIPGARTEVIRERCAEVFAGPVIVGEDLMSVAV